MDDAQHHDEQATQKQAPNLEARKSSPEGITISTDDPVLQEFLIAMRARRRLMDGAGHSGQGHSVQIPTVPRITTSSRLPQTARKNAAYKATWTHDEIFQQINCTIIRKKTNPVRKFPSVAGSSYAKKPKLNAADEDAGKLRYR
jgi:hypothetical protein